MVGGSLGGANEDGSRCSLARWPRGRGSEGGATDNNKLVLMNHHQKKVICVEEERRRLSVPTIVTKTIAHPTAPPTPTQTHARRAFSTHFQSTVANPLPPRRRSKCPRAPL
jgi:hypothetical protein